MANDKKGVNASNVFSFSNGQLTALPAASSNVAVNTLIANTTPPRGPRVETISLDDVLGAAGAGAENGTSGSTAKTLSVLGNINDAVSVGQHVVQGNGAETVSEGMGVIGGAGGAAAGAWTGSQFGARVGSLFPPIAPATTALGATAGAAVGAYGGSSTLKATGEYLTGGSKVAELTNGSLKENTTAIHFGNACNDVLIRKAA